MRTGIKIDQCNVFHVSHLRNIIDDSPIASAADGSRVYITRDKLQSDYICASYVDVRMNKLY